MIKKIVDNRLLKPTKLCDAVVEIDTNLNLPEHKRIIRYFQAYDVQDVLLISNSLNEGVIVYIYDLNSKPLK